MVHGILPVLGGAFRIVAHVDGGFEQRALALFQLAERLALMDQRFFGLLLLAVQPKQTVTRLRRGPAQRLNTRFRFRDLCRAEGGTRRQLFHASVHGDGLRADIFHHLLLRRVTRFPLGGLRGDGVAFRGNLFVAASQFRAARLVKHNAVFVAVNF